MKSSVPDETSIRYEGWRIVAVCFAVATFSWALGFYGQSVYLAELQRLHGWPASLISTATTFYYLGGALLVAFVGDAIRMVGPRACLLGGLAATALGTALLGRVDAPWQLYGIYVLLAIGWAGTSLGAITSTLGLWFDKRRGMAISLALNGASFGGIAGVPLLVLAIGHLGFAGATLAVALSSLLVIAPLVAIFVGRPPLPAASVAGAGAVQALSSGAIRRHALRDKDFLIVTIAFALVLFAQVGFIVHVIAYLDPLIGRERAAAAVSLLTMMAVVGRVSMSAVIDRINQRLASALSFASQAAALTILILTRDPVLMLVACALFGFSVGNLITLPALIVQREFAPASFGVLVSLNTAINQVTYAFGPGVVGLLRDASGSYTLPFAACIALELIAAVLILVRGRK
ncbi:MFS transporter [Rhodopseudomonas sp. HC1]|uniref:MFS transporter n=1 Tax=Rhodopseudomonas infernalis TaxID=2897386 RepID=UPI001EE995EE|nr:MFS transporter [Rhodopseudomonas infernalis]MCG6207244.1 MFS transporter [Rhodopseudomonas infernalis]